MIRNRFDNLETERQQKLFESAADEFADHGYDGASLNRILEKSGMSKSSLYYYFDDKADLFSSMVERAMIYLFREVGGFDIDKLTSETYWSELEAVFLRSAVMMNRNTWYLRLGRAVYRLRGSKRKHAPVEKLFDLARHWMETLIRKGQELGVVRADLPHSMLIDSAMGLGEALDHWAVDHWDEFGDEERLKVFSAQLGMFKRLFDKDAEEGV